MTEPDEPGTRAYCLGAEAGNYLWEKNSPAKDYGAEKEGYSENGRELAPASDRTIEEQGSPFYARKPKPEPFTSL